MTCCSVLTGGRSKADEMAQSLIVLAIIMILVEIKSESTGEFFAPSTIIFHDIYTNSFTATEEDNISTVTEDYSIDSKTVQFVEFHPLAAETSTIPPPKYLLKSNQEKITTTTTTSTTEDPADIIKVVPIKKNYQRGLLDLLFPPKRVKTFKNVFDSIRRVLSHTFRR